MLSGMVAGVVIGAVLAVWLEVLALAFIWVRVRVVQWAERLPVLRILTYRGSGDEARAAARAGSSIVS